MDSPNVDCGSPVAKTVKIDDNQANEVVKEIIDDIVCQLDGSVEEEPEEELQGKADEIPPVNAENDANLKVDLPPSEERGEPAVKQLTKEASAESSASTSGTTSNASEDVYQVKWITWKDDQTVPIVTQNSNGPCPMLAIANVLLLRGKMKLVAGCEVVSFEQLIEQLGNTMLECVPQSLSADRRLDYEANVSDAVELLPKLQTGIDVSVKFSGVTDFEYTSECIIFDLFNIVLYHGWLVDPQQEDVVKSIDGLSYNQLVEKIIANKNSDDGAKVGASLTAQNFLEESASQLTYHGLCELNSTLKEDELAIFFRNNHFSTIYKRNSELFLLVTDQGFLKEPSVVWETLSSICGDGHFVDGKFVTAPPKASPAQQNPVQPSKSLSPEQQIDQDEELARRLQGEENASVQPQPAAQNDPTGPSNSSNSPPQRTRNCVIL